MGDILNLHKCVKNGRFLFEVLLIFCFSFQWFWRNFQDHWMIECKGHHTLLNILLNRFAWKFHNGLFLQDSWNKGPQPYACTPITHAPKYLEQSLMVFAWNLYNRAHFCKTIETRGHNPLFWPQLHISCLTKMSPVVKVPIKPLRIGQREYQWT